MAEYKYSIAELCTLATKDTPSDPIQLPCPTPSATLPFHGRIPDRDDYVFGRSDVIQKPPAWPDAQEFCKLSIVNRQDLPNGRRNRFEQCYLNYPLQQTHGCRWYSEHDDGVFVAHWSQSYSYLVWVEVSRLGHDEWLDYLGDKEKGLSGDDAPRLMLARFPRSDETRTLAPNPADQHMSQDHSDNVDGLQEHCDTRICELEYPKSINLRDNVFEICLNVSQGTVILCLEDGPITILHYV